MAMVVSGPTRAERSSNIIRSSPSGKLSRSPQVVAGVLVRFERSAYATHHRATAAYMEQGAFARGTIAASPLLEGSLRTSLPCSTPQSRVSDNPRAARVRHMQKTDLRGSPLYGSLLGWQEAARGSCTKCNDSKDVDR